MRAAVFIAIMAVVYVCSRFIPAEPCDSEGFSPTAREFCK